jgi:hypothetical protein
MDKHAAYFQEQRRSYSVLAWNFDLRHRSLPGDSWYDRHEDIIGNETFPIVNAPGNRKAKILVMLLSPEELIRVKTRDTYIL